MSEAYLLVQTRCKKAKDKADEKWKRRIIANKLEVGDKVLVRNKREKGGPGKTRGCWEQRIYLVQEVLLENTLYRIKSIESLPEVRVLHRNMLLPCNDMEYLKLITSSKEPKEQQDKHLN